MSKPPKYDKIYAQALDTVGQFTFDEKVVGVFENMIKRSVPGYGSVISMLSAFAQKYVQADSRCYDLGCSLGASTLAIRHHIRQPGVEIIAIDNSQDMLTRCHDIVLQDSNQTPVSLVCADLRDVKIENASLVVMNFTLQFIPVSDRQALVNTIYNGLRPGGAFVLSEKIAFEQTQEQDFYTDVHHAFKKANGYSDLEISQKRTALENFLIPETVDEHFSRFKTAGFTHYHHWFKCLNFASFIGVK